MVSANSGVIPRSDPGGSCAVAEKEQGSTFLVRGHAAVHPSYMRDDPNEPQFALCCYRRVRSCGSVHRRAICKTGLGAEIASLESTGLDDLRDPTNHARGLGRRSQGQSAGDDSFCLQDLSLDYQSRSVGGLDGQDSGRCQCSESAFVYGPAGIEGILG